MKFYLAALFVLSLTSVFADEGTLSLNDVKMAKTIIKKYKISPVKIKNCLNFKFSLNEIKEYQDYYF